MNQRWLEAEKAAIACRTYAYDGLTHLGMGDEEAARKCFEKARKEAKLARDWLWLAPKESG